MVGGLNGTRQVLFIQLLPGRDHQLGNDLADVARLTSTVTG